MQIRYSFAGRAPELGHTMRVGLSPIPKVSTAPGGTQRVKQCGQTLRLVQNQAGARAGIELKAWVFGKQDVGGRVLQIQIRKNGEGLPRQGGFAHLTRPENQHGGKLARKMRESLYTKARIHDVYFQSRTLILPDIQPTTITLECGNELYC